MRGSGRRGGLAAPSLPHSAVLLDSSSPPIGAPRPPGVGCSPRRRRGLHCRPRLRKGEHHVVGHPCGDGAGERKRKCSSSSSGCSNGDGRSNLSSTDDGQGSCTKGDGSRNNPSSDWQGFCAPSSQRKGRSSNRRRGRRGSQGSDSTGRGGRDSQVDTSTALGR